MSRTGRRSGGMRPRRKRLLTCEYAEHAALWSSSAPRGHPPASSLKRKVLSVSNTPREAQRALEGPMPLSTPSPSSFWQYPGSRSPASCCKPAHAGSSRCSRAPASWSGSASGHPVLERAEHVLDSAASRPQVCDPGVAVPAQALLHVPTGGLQNNVTFPILSDPKNDVATSFGLKFALPDYFVDPLQKAEERLAGLQRGSELDAADARSLRDRARRQDRLR